MHGGRHCRTSRCSEKNSGEPRDECMPRARNTFYRPICVPPQASAARSCRFMLQTCWDMTVDCAFAMAPASASTCAWPGFYRDGLEKSGNHRIIQQKEALIAGSCPIMLLKARFLLGQRQLCNPAKTIYGRFDIRTLLSQVGCLSLDILFQTSHPAHRSTLLHLLIFIYPP